mgnify:CR=1 FL=1
MRFFTTILFCFCSFNAFTTQLDNPYFLKKGRNWKSRGADFLLDMPKRISQARLTSKYNINYIAQKMKLKKGNYKVVISAKGNNSTRLRIAVTKSLKRLKMLSERNGNSGRKEDPTWSCEDLTSSKKKLTYEFRSDNHINHYLVLWLEAESSDRKNKDYFIDIPSVQVVRIN